MEKAKKKSKLDVVIDTISGIFLPIISVLTAAGIMKGMLALSISTGLLIKGSESYLVCNAIADALFYFLPIFVAFTAAKKFGCDQFSSVAVAGILVYPELTEAFKQADALHFAGIKIDAVNYPSSVIPILMAVGFMYFVEKFLKKVIPEIVRGFLTPLFSIIIVSMATLFLFGPAGTWIGDLLAGGYTAAYEFNPVVAGILLGGFAQIIVMFGFHWSLVPIAIANIALYGSDTILAFLGPASFGQAGAGLAVFLKLKDKSQKGVVISAVVSALFGITEPIMFGANLPLKKPMIAVCTAGAIGGGLVGLSGAAAIAFAFPGIPTLPVFAGEGFFGFLAACTLGFFIAFALTMIMKFEVKLPTEKTTKDL